MIKILSLTGAVALLGIASTMQAQFNPLPAANSVTGAGPFADAYAELIDTHGWNSRSVTALWGAPQTPVEGAHFDAFGMMNIIFIGEGAAARNDFGIHWGVPETPYGNDNSTFDNSETVFRAIEAPASIQQGHFLTLALDGRTSFDFWVSAEIRRTTGPGGIWSLLNPSLNSTGSLSSLQGKGTLQMIDGEAYYLFAVARPGQEQDDLVFGLHFFNADGAPFTPVPEPSTYGALGALLLFGMIFQRRLRKRKSQVTTP